MKKFVALLCFISLAISFNGNGNHVKPLLPQFGIHSDGIELIEQFSSIEEFVNECYAKGYSIILFNVIPWEYYFISPTLEELGWEFGEDMLSPLITKAHEKGIKVFADVQSLAWKARESYPDWPGNVPSVQQIISIINELIDYGVDGISEEMFPAQWFFPVYEICKEKGITYLHKGIPYDVAWFCEDNSTVFDAYSNCHVLMTEDYYMNDDLARNEIIPSFASGLEKSCWIKSCPEKWALGSVENMENVLLMRMLQYHPEYIFAMIYNRSDFEEFDPSSLLTYQDMMIEEKKPICNVVVYLTNESGTENNPGDIDPWQLLEISFSAIANGIMASGYKIVITPLPIKNADMYYIYTRGKWWDESSILDLPDEIINLFYENKTAFLEVGGVLPASTPNWQIVRSKIGLDNNEYDTLCLVGESIEGEYKDMPYTHLGDDWFIMNEIRPWNVKDGEILSTCDYDGDTYALIIKKGNFVFINGAGLDMDAGFPISNIINDCLQFPSKCIITSGYTSTFYAFDDTYLKIKLPYEVSDLKWMKRSINGEIKEGELEYNTIYTDFLQKGTLLVLMAEGNISTKIICPEDALYINGKKIMPLKKPFIVGSITVKIEVNSNIEVKDVKFYVDDTLKKIDNDEPYEWTWNEKGFGKHSLAVIASDIAGNTDEIEKEIWMANWRN
ncbi:MAG: hypothetical protein J7L80_04435 [Thermoplasmata archaeon]|nr:hypothetical protein [Thermoplasmata archaeon]